MTYRQHLWSDSIMHPRYPAPVADRLWSSASRISRLRTICDLYTIDALKRGLLLPYDVVSVSESTQIILSAPNPTEDAWKDGESLYGHDIVGFLQAYLDRLPAEIHPFVHFGLTSSDLVEYDLHHAMWEHAQALSLVVDQLCARIATRSGHMTGLYRAGRTHGQTAELTDLGFQLVGYANVFSKVGYDLSQFRVPPMKSPGPTGFSDIRTVPLASEDFPVISTQIIPRDWMLKWACVYLRLANALDQFATFIRFGCRSEIAEFVEGAAASRQGSSAMPGKRNPIDSEKICGLARVARGHFFALAQEANLWEDRDLSNSSTERIAVPGLAATVEHMTETAFSVIRDLVINESAIQHNATDPRTRANARQMELQRQGHGPISASKLEQENQS